MEHFPIVTFWAARLILFLKNAEQRLKGLYCLYLKVCLKQMKAIQLKFFGLQQNDGKCW